SLEMFFSRSSVFLDYIQVFFLQSLAAGAPVLIRSLRVATCYILNCAYRNPGATNGLAMRYITAELGCNKPLEGFRRAQIGQTYTILNIFLLCPTNLSLISLFLFN